MDERYLRAYFAEFVGTFALVFISAGAASVAPLGGLQPWSVSIALAAGLVYAGALAITLPISGGYLNPAITLMLWVFKRIDGGKAVGLILVQFLGGVVAAFGVRLLYPIKTFEAAAVVSRLGAPHLNREVFGGMTLAPMLKGVGVELVLTFVLCFVLYGLLFDPRAKGWKGTGEGRLTALWLGLVLAAVTIVGYPLTGGAVNPARWFGPVLAETTIASLNDLHPFEDNPIYWIGPIAGALIAGWLYTSLVLPPEEEQRAAQPSHTTGHPVAATSTLFRAKK